MYHVPWLDVSKVVGVDSAVRAEGYPAPTHPATLAIKLHVLYGGILPLRV